MKQVFWAFELLFVFLIVVIAPGTVEQMAKENITALLIVSGLTQLPLHWGYWRFVDKNGRLIRKVGVGVALFTTFITFVAIMLQPAESVLASILSGIGVGAAFSLLLLPIITVVAHVFVLNEGK